ASLGLFGGVLRSAAGLRLWLRLSRPGCRGGAAVGLGPPVVAAYLSPDPAPSTSSQEPNVSREAFGTPNPGSCAQPPVMHHSGFWPTVALVVVPIRLAARAVQRHRTLAEERHDVQISPGLHARPCGAW